MSSHNHDAAIGEPTVKPRDILCVLVTLLVAGRTYAQPKGYNYDEAKVPSYTLPDPLRFNNGEIVEEADDWPKRRQEILDLFRTDVYGISPGEPEELQAEVVESSTSALDGRAVRKQVVLHLKNGEKSHELDVLVYLPREAARPVPVFLTLNFRGNHTIHADPAIRLPKSWLPADSDSGVVDHRATEKGRGARASRWDVDAILARGYGLATVYCGDIDPDFHDGFKNGVHALFPKWQDDYGKKSWGTVAGWAWGLSRVMDYFEKDEDIDAKRVAVMGHSRLGKTSLWAGASDPRFAIVISNDSGCGGAALSRRRFGETVERINTSFPHWFCDTFKQYNGNEDAIPVDQHQLIALIAPRPVYIASAEDDQWADPKGEFLSGLHADPVYKLLGTPGLPAKEWPAVDQPVQGQIGYHVRSGGHDVKPFDWNAYLDFADKHWARK